jgi:ATP-dependent DNA helicase PIF1
MPRSSPIKTSPSKASKSRRPLKQEELTVTQRAALSACLAGHNVFLTGGAGTGKSSLVALIVERMRRQHGEDAVFVTATTGLAACAIGGSTLHNFAGIGGLFHEGDDMNKAVQEVLNKAVAVKRWRTCKVLVLDEVSMLSGSLLELVDLIGQRCRCNNRTLGGVQLVICGDFFQLPPISSKGTASLSFAFQSPVWAKCKFTNIVLDRVFRQSDSTFIALLEAVRRGELSPEGLALLNQRVGRNVHDHASGVVATKILTHKADVDRCNDAELSHLAGEAHEYVASDSGEQKHAKFLDDYCPAKKSLKLKLRAQVILLKTIDAEKGLVNGARGIVVGFGAAPSYRPLVRFAPAASSGLSVLERTIGLEAFTTQSGGTVLATRMQLPLAGGWALSVHRSQGMSVDRAELHLSGVFEVGQAYVALSRVRTIEGLRLASPLLQGHIRVHAAVKSFYASIEERSHSDSQL